MNMTRAFGAALAASLLLIAVPSASAAPRISVQVKRTINFGGSAKLTGTLAGLVKNSGVRVQLQERLYPYNGPFETVASKNTGAKGRFAFRVSPDRNSRYRVRAATGSPTSRQAPVYVNGIPLTFIKTKKGSSTITARMTFEFSPLLSTTPFTNLKLRWYYKPKSSKSFRRVKTTRTKRVRAGKIGGSMKYKLPAATANQKFTIAWCFRPHKHGDVGIGDPKRSFKACP
ncbi:MAG: hypothetical protein QOH76_67 [Thermoleophilaceae bacterium]|nr:hypothetical protein [Thermoleophilaceae bacterium]